MRFEVKFEGDLADDHKIPAYEGAKSLQGLSRSLLMVSNYLVEGKVRRKNFERIPIEFNLIAHQPGSFETVYEIIYHAAVFGGPVLADGVATNLLTDLIRSTFSRVTGRGEAKVPDELGRLEAERGGDLAALVEAIEPAVRLGHNVINHGVININIGAAAQADEPIAALNPETKHFVWENVVNNDVRIKLFSIGSFNANNGTGRAYDLEESRSIPFELAGDVDRLTVDTLLKSISSYTRKRRLGDDIGSAIAVRYTSVDAIDGRLKKMRVLAARDEIDAL